MSSVGGSIGDGGNGCVSGACGGGGGGGSSSGEGSGSGSSSSNGNRNNGRGSGGNMAAVEASLRAC